MEQVSVMSKASQSLSELALLRVAVIQIARIISPNATSEEARFEIDKILLLK
jgi:hypothetical protein